MPDQTINTWTAGQACLLDREPAIIRCVCGDWGWVSKLSDPMTPETVALGLLELPALLQVSSHD